MPIINNRISTFKEIRKVVEYRDRRTKAIVYTTPITFLLYYCFVLFRKPIRSIPQTITSYSYN